MVYGVVDPPKKLLVAIGKAAIDGEGEQPWLITLADLSRRTGWTFSELDEQDASLVLPALIGQSVRDALKRVDAYVQSQGKLRPDENDLALYGDILKLMAGE